MIAEAKPVDETIGGSGGALKPQEPSEILKLLLFKKLLLLGWIKNSNFCTIHTHSPTVVIYAAINGNKYIEQEQKFIFNSIFVVSSLRRVWQISEQYQPSANKDSTLPCP